MLSVTDLGLNRGSEGVDFDANLAVSSIDFGTFHVRSSQCTAVRDFHFLLLCSHTQLDGAKEETSSHGELNGLQTMPRLRKPLTSQ